MTQGKILPTIETGGKVEIPPGGELLIFNRPSALTPES